MHYLLPDVIEVLGAAVKTTGIDSEPALLPGTMPSELALPFFFILEEALRHRSWNF